MAAPTNDPSPISPGDLAARQAQAAKAGWQTGDLQYNADGSVTILKAGSSQGKMIGSNGMMLNPDGSPFIDQSGTPTYLTDTVGANYKNDPGSQNDTSNLGAIKGAVKTAANYIGINPAKPGNDLGAALDRASTAAKALADQQWQRQMTGLSQALGYTNHSQQAFDRIYNQPANAPGSTLPIGMRPPGVGPSGMAMSTMPQAPDPNAGLQALLSPGSAPPQPPPGAVRFQPQPDGQMAPGQIPQQTAPGLQAFFRNQQMGGR